MSKVHYWELSNYNDGKLIGKWFDVDGITAEDHKQDITDWLDSLPANNGYKCEEWILGDVDDIPREFVGVWDIDDAFFDLMAIADNSQLELRVFIAGLELGIPIDKIEENYIGEFDSVENLAIDFVENTGMLDDVDNNIAMYFDYEKFGRDLAMDYVENDSYYFHSSW